MNSDWYAVYVALRNVYCDNSYSNLAINEALKNTKYPRRASFVLCLRV